ncbi:uncharacterized protein LOC122539332 isoform X2 [Chiloscyllium plagiosum]|uniref:uncharacterized protein LOC122539332 isoform X2 n=1 Tax=Chiloscyllium plagiosum TaxID=36176 RepID=UPI001CB82CFD|nr:uncharacterized protein LOC122539332 isoform X2 [Chiloscyllium plagiosum]
MVALTVTKGLLMAFVLAFCESQTITQGPLHTYLLSQSNVSGTLNLSKGIGTVMDEVNKEVSNPSEILASAELLAYQLVTTAPTLAKFVEDTDGILPTPTSAFYGTRLDNTCTNPPDVSIFGVKAWKFGLISAVIPIFLVVEGLALAIYCTKCKKRRRKAMPVKSYDDSEAAETINAESNENTVTMNNTTLAQAKGPLEISETESFSEVAKKAIDEDSQDLSDLDTNFEG